MVLWAEKAPVIPPSEAANVKVTEKDNDYAGDLFVDLSLRAEENADHCIPGCIMSTNSRLLPVINLADHALKIKEKQTVARAKVVRPALSEELKMMSIKKKRENTIFQSIRLKLAIKFPLK